MVKNGREITIVISPYATQYGTLVVPNDKNTEFEINEYIEEHFDEIDFDEPSLDYRGVDFEFYDEED